MIEDVLLEAIGKMERAVEHVQSQFSSVRTGRANAVGGQDRPVGGGQEAVVAIPGRVEGGRGDERRLAFLVGAGPDVLAHKEPDEAEVLLKELAEAEAQQARLAAKTN